MIFQYTDYRDYLQDILKQRQKRNNAYSLRAFARDLGVPASTLCGVLRKGKNLTTESAQKVTAHLQLRSKENRYFHLLLEKELLENLKERIKKEDEIRFIAQQALRENIQCQKKQQEVLSHALKFALIELGGIEHFHLTPSSAAKVLRLSEEEAHVHLHSLEKAGALSFHEEDQSFRKKGAGVFVSSAEVSVDLRRFHLETLELAKKSLAEQTPQERFIGSETFSFDSHQLSEANDIMEECFSKLILLANRSTKKDSVYHAGIQMFRLTRAGGLFCD